MYRTSTTPLSVIAATRAQPSARRALYSVSEMPSKRSLALLDVVLSGTQPVCEPLPCSAPKVDSEYGVDVCIYIADERSCMVLCANGYSMVGDPAVWTCMTKDSWTAGSLPMCEPHMCADLSFSSSVALGCGGTLCSHTWTVSGLRCQRNG